MPKVSVVVPIWNAAAYLPECLASLRRQTLGDIEIICVDDGSDDNTPAVLAKAAAVDGRIKVLRQENAGAGAARNAGLAVATGEYVFFCDPDDWCDADMLETFYRKCKACDADVLIAPLVRFDSATRAAAGEMKFPAMFGRYMAEDVAIAPAEIAGQIFTVGGNGPCNKLFRRALAVEKDIRFQHLRRTNDLYFVKTFLASAKRIVFSGRACYHYRRGIDSATHRDELSDSFCFALEALRERLIADGLVPVYAESFGRLAVGSFIFNMKSISDPGFRVRWYQSVRPRMLAIMADNDGTMVAALAAKERAVFKAVIASEDIAPVLATLNKYELAPAKAAPKAPAAQKPPTPDDLKRIRARLSDYAKKVVAGRKDLHAARRKLAGARNDLAAQSRELAGLHLSLAYKVGLFLTFPLRAIHRRLCRMRNTATAAR